MIARAMAMQEFDDKSGRSRGQVVSFVVAVIVSLAVFLAIVPGAPVTAPAIFADGKYGPHFEVDQQVVEHGWPWRFLSHEGGRSRGFELSPWRIGKNVNVSVVALLGDLCIAITLVYLAFRYARRRTRMRGWQIAFRELAAVVLCASVLLALIARRRDLHRVQVEYLINFTQQGDIEYAEWEPFGPHWLRQLTGDEYWRSCDRLLGVWVDDSENADKLPGKESIQVLRFVRFNCESPPALDEFTNLKAVDILLPEGQEFDDNSIDWRLALPILAKCKGLRGLNLHENGVSNRDLPIFATMANLENLCISSNYAIDDRGLMHLASLKKLRQLELWDTGVTSKGVARLQKSLPECEIHWNDPDAP